MKVTGVVLLAGLLGLHLYDLQPAGVSADSRTSHNQWYTRTVGQTCTAHQDCESNFCGGCPGKWDSTSGIFNPDMGFYIGGPPGNEISYQFRYEASFKDSLTVGAFGED